MEIIPETIETWERYVNDLPPHWEHTNLFIGYYESDPDTLVVSGAPGGEAEISDKAIKVGKRGQFVLHNPDGPAAIIKKGRAAWWYLHGEFHREDGPAQIDLDKKYQAYFVNGERHRLDGPALISCTEHDNGDEFRQTWYRSHYVNNHSIPSDVWDTITHAKREEDLLKYLTSEHEGDRYLARHKLNSLNKSNI